MDGSPTNYSGCLRIYGGLVEMIFLFAKGVTLAGEPAIHFQAFLWMDFWLHHSQFHRFIGKMTVIDPE